MVRRWGLQCPCPRAVLQKCALLSSLTAVSSCQAYLQLTLSEVKLCLLALVVMRCMVRHMICSTAFFICSFVFFLPTSCFPSLSSGVMCASCTSPERFCRQRMEKERFYRGQQSTTRGFMGMALQALSVLTRLAANPAIQARSGQSMCKCNTDSHTLSSCTSTARSCLFEIFTNIFCQDIVHHCKSLLKNIAHMSESLAGEIPCRVPCWVHQCGKTLHVLQAAFLRPPLVGRAAYATLAFLNALGGPRFASLQACLIHA